MKKNPLFFSISLIVWGHFLGVCGLKGVVLKSSDYALTGGTVKLGGSTSKSAAYSNMGFVRGGRHIADGKGAESFAGGGEARVEVVSTGFRLVPSLVFENRTAIARVEHTVAFSNGTQASLPAIATSLVGGVVQFSTGAGGGVSNVRPVLEWEDLEPFEGVPSDEFTFKVFYLDEDGDSPVFMKLHLDDQEHLMKVEGKSGDPAEGMLYSVKVGGLEWGPHEFSFSTSDGTHEVKTFWEEGPFVEGDDPDFNHPPELWGNDVKPWVAPVGENFAFSITYEDEDGDTPEFVQVVVDGKTYEMVASTKRKKSNPLKGIAYEAKIGGLTWGPHDHYFVASDGKDVSRTRQEHGPFVEGDDPDWNQPPEISEEGVEPWDGTPSAEFVFQLFYQDEEGDAPEYVRVVVDGQSHDMQLPDGSKTPDYVKGAWFEYKAKGLSWGPHRHQFFASDGMTVVSTRLEVGPYVEGEDPDWNYPPELTDEVLEPWVGTPADEYVFQVIYLDEEGEAPEFVHLELDGQTYEMRSLGKGTAIKGITYRVAVEDLHWGPHSHRFAASDGQNLTVTDLMQAPMVQGEDPDWNYPPELEEVGVDPWDGSPSETFVFKVFYYDEEGDSPEFVKLVLDGKDYAMKQFTRKSADGGLEFLAEVTGLNWGPHHYQFAASDGTTVTTTPMEEGPYVQGDDPNWNYVPELWDEGPEPWEGVPDETFEFSVYYYDVDNDVPDYVKLFLDGREYAMKQDGSDAYDDDDGARFTVTVKDSLDWGPHVYRFVAASGDHVVSTAPQQGPVIAGDNPDWNEPPELEVIEVDPWDGIPETEFMFFVSYRDEEGDAPQKVELVLDGTAYSMRVEEGDDYTEEVIYSAVISGLDWGPHSYKASAEVGGETFETSLEQGPYVDGEPEGWNLVPELEPIAVEPWDGTPNDEFTFTVSYMDENGDPPEFVRLVLDGKDYPMASVGQADDFEDGVEYTAQVSGLTWGPHRHYFVASDGQEVASTRPEEAPVLEGDDPNWNEPAYLENSEVDPDPGLPSDEFTFRITYIDDEGSAPEFVKVVLDGKDHVMKAEGKAGRFDEGVVYSTTVKGLSWGPHTSRFVASDGVHVTLTDPEQMPFVEGDDPGWNEAPYLEEEGVEPWDGTPVDEFVFRVIYTDDENEAPDYVRLLLDGQVIEMSPVGKGGRYYRGVVYEVAVTDLTWGPHRYQFVASDGNTEVKTQLTQGPMVEGEDPDWNYAPELWDGQVNPEEGPVDGTFTYSVYYQDEEGDAPGYVQLKLSKKNYPMKASGKKLHYAKGVLYMVQVKALGKGPHAYIFEASDGQNETTTELNEGPWIEGEESEGIDDYPPELDRERLKPDYGTPDTTFVFSVRYRDLEGTPPRSIAVEVDNRSYPMFPAPVKKAKTHVKGVVYEASVTGLGWGPHRYRFVSSDVAFSVATPWEQGPVIGGEDPNWNAPPELEDYWVDPEDGSPVDEYVFTVTYIDEDDDPPAQIHLFLDGKKYVLASADPKNKRYYRGVDYTATVKGLDWGPHSYYFVASDGNSPVSSGRIQGPYVLGEDPDWNTPPELGDYEITPEDGSPADTFDFRVTYFDEENTEPKSVQLILDGKAHKMAKADSKADDYAVGVDYIVSVNGLDWGPHAFRFQASDGTTQVWTELDRGPYVMGASPDWNEAPEFGDYDVEPYDGTPADEFTFWINYNDQEGDKPAFVKLRIDGKDYTMAKENAKANDYQDGVTYVAKVGGLDWGPHRYSFSASDGNSTISTSPEVGPYIQGDSPDWNSAPELSGDFEPWDGMPSAEFQFRVEYWDEEGDAPRYVRLFLDGKQFVMQPEHPKAKLGRKDYRDGVGYVATVTGLEWGPHQHYFSTSDGANAVRTRLTGGPFLYGEDPDFNYAPEFIGYDLEPWDGPPSTTFEFHVEYADPEGAAPEFVRLFVDGEARDMKLSSKEQDPDFEDGVSYVANVTGLDWGPHAYFFESSDGTTVVRSSVEAGPYVEGEDTDWNRPPDLEDGEVDPWDAEPGVPLKFRVFYSDEEGDAPAFVRAFLDGEQIDLKPEKAVTNHSKRTAYSSTIENTLAWGPHQYWFSASDGENVVVTQPEQGPILYGDDPNWDTPPYLEGDGVDPWDGSPDAEFTFIAIYEDEGNQPPAYVKLHLDDQVIDMEPLDPKAKLFAKGVEYVAKFKGLAWGPHKHRFSTSDGAHEVFTQWEQGPFIQGEDSNWNQPPDLKNAQVKPWDGDPDTEFVFKVRYIDEDNEAPTFIRLLIDGQSYDMAQFKESKAYYKGVYYQVVVAGLAWGPHRYFFTASDGTHTSTTLVESGPNISGEDPNRNFQPEITDWEVEPWGGGPGTEFIFTAEYEDYDGDVPEYVRLLLDGKSYDMAPVGENPNYLKGALFSVAVKGLGWGPHHYQFVVSDGKLTDQTRLEAGPYVMGSDSGRNRAPVLRSLEFEPPAGSPEDNFIFSVLYTDAESDSPEYVNLALGDYLFPMTLDTDAKSTLPGVVYSISLTGLPPGSHKYAFEASDGRNLGETRWLKGPKITGQKPKVLTRLAHQRIPVGKTLTLSIEAQGTRPMSYRWLRDGEPIEGATESTLTLNDVHVDDIGVYRAEVTNIVGTARSNAAKVLIVEPPEIVEGPSDTTVTFRESFELSANASGTPRLAYQWYRDGQPVSKAVKSLLKLKAYLSVEGTYTVKVSNDAGSAVSAPAQVVILHKPIFAETPTAVSVVAGKSATFSAKAVAKDAAGTDVTYQWFKGKEQINGATDRILALGPVGPAEVSAYTVRVSNQVGSTKSRPVRLTVLYPPEIVTQPKDSVALVGRKAQFVIKAKGTKILKYQWYKDDQPVKDATRNRLMINPVNVEDAGAYKVGVTNEVGAVESNVAILTLSAASEVVAESLDWKTPFTEWIALEDLSGAQATQYADGDDDGVSNLLEYAFAGNPYQSDPDILPEAVMMTDLEGARFLALTWRESAEATDVSYRVQTSSDLKVWAEMDLSTFAVSRVENGSHAEVTVYLPLDLTSKFFLRLAVITEE